MKILLLTEGMELGGAETHIAQLARGLAASQNEVTLLSEGGRMAKEAESAGVRLLCYPQGLSHGGVRWLFLRRWVFKLVRNGRFDVVHAHTRRSALLIKGVRRLGVAEVVTVHARFRTDPFLTRICNWGTRTVAVSEDLRAYVCDCYKVPAERVCVIPNGIDCQRFSPSPSPSPSRFLHVVFASRMDADCALGAELLCALATDLVRCFSTVRITLAGGGSELARISELAKAANQAAGALIVSAVGSVSDMAELLRGADVFVGVSRAAMEAAACGLPVVLCGNEGYGGILTEENRETALLSNLCARGRESANKASLLRDLQILLSSADLRKSYGEAGREWILRRCNATESCCATLALYRSACPQNIKRRLTVGGYCGCGNLGDDAMLEGFLTELRQTAPDIGVTVLSGSPHTFRRRFGVSCVHRKNPIGILVAMLRSDWFLCGGGSLMQNQTGRLSLFYYMTLLYLSRLLGCRTVLYAAGIGPLIGNGAIAAVKRLPLVCDRVSLREEASYLLLCRLGVDRAKLFVGADPALLMPLPPPGRGEAILTFCGISHTKRFLGVILRGGRDGKGQRSTVLDAVRMICRRHGTVPLFLVFDCYRDTEASRAATDLAGGYVVPLRETSDAAAILRLCRAAVSMRLHASVLATAVGLPCVGVTCDARDHKIEAFSKAAGQDFLPEEALTVGALVELIEQNLETRNERRALLLSSAEQMRRAAKEEIARILRL